MPSADDTRRTSIQVGHSAPTGPQTLLILLNLYISDNTDYPTWVETVESHPLTLGPFLAAQPPHRLTDWPTAFSLEDLQKGVFAIANKVNLTGLLDGEEDNPYTCGIARMLADMIDPAIKRKAELTCRIVRLPMVIPDPDVADAVSYSNRPLWTLHGSSLLIRLVAVACHCSEEQDVDIAECASLLSLTEEQITSVLPESHPSPPDTVIEGDVIQLEKAIGAVNLIESSIALARQTSRETAIQALAWELFDAGATSVFTESSEGWYNQTHRFESPYSMILQAASTGEPVSTQDHTIIVADEKILAEMGFSNGLAIPVFITNHEKRLCVAVILLAMEVETLERALERSLAMEQFGQVVSHLFTAHLEMGIDAESVDRRAREIVHEANNPISTVQNYLKALSLKLGPEHEAQETLESISSELFRAADIVRSFNDLKHLRHNQQGVSDVNKIMKQIGLLFEEGHNATIEYQLDESNPSAQIHGNGLKQILTNLIKNATESTTGENTITLRTVGDLRQGSETFVELSVRDTGLGIDSHIRNVFDRGATTKTGDHTGDGLAVVKQITEAANGFVSYRSNQNGTEFRVTVPQVQNR